MTTKTGNMSRCNTCNTHVTGKCNTPKPRCAWDVTRVPGKTTLYMREVIKIYHYKNITLSRI